MDAPISFHQDNFLESSKNHYKALKSYATTINPYHGEDVVQDVYLGISSGEIRPPRNENSIKSYLFGIVRNKINSLFRRRLGSIVNFVTFENLPDVPVENKALVDEFHTIINTAILSLPADQREALLLHKFDDKTYSEIAEIMDVNEHAVKYLLKKAMTHLKLTLANNGFEF